MDEKNHPVSETDNEISESPAETEISEEQKARNEMISKIVISKTFSFPNADKFSEDDFNLIYYPNPRLKQKSLFDPMKMDKEVLSKLVNKLNTLMLELDGIGLAAPQVGWQARVFSMKTTEGPIAIINPKIISKRMLVDSEEGCLSFPDVDGMLKRYNYITIEHDDVDGKSHTVELSGLAAFIVQHEMDHLDGKLFVDKLSSTSKFQNRHYIKNLELLWNVDADKFLEAHKIASKEEGKETTQEQEVKI